ncbi:retrovirus-related Pol polyprotein from transposon 412 [Trichonephila clavipes]|nr:retrovirus-related Pol polyprotein from transposon 412 [Trichonephila clavipes]
MAFLGKGKKQDMLQLAEELGINATLNMTVPSIKIAITNSEGYEEEFVKNLYETIIANGKRLEELERAEKNEIGRSKILNAVQTRSQVKAAREERGIDSGDAKKGEDEVIIVSSDAEDEILIPALQEYVPELALLRVTRENLINAQKNSEEIKPLYEQAASQVQVTNQRYGTVCKNCDQCQKAGKPNDKKKAPLKLVPVIQEVFTKLNIDACGPLPITSKGNRYLITAICMSSKFPEAIPVSDISSCSDYRVFERFGILVRHSSVYHPQSNPVEQFHRALKRLLRVLCLEAGSEWDKHLPSILLALRTVSHESTGYTPSELVYGKNLRTPEALVMEHWMEPEEEG